LRSLGDAERERTSAVSRDVGVTTPIGLTLADVSASHASLFRTFAAHTDEQQVLATAIVQFMEEGSLKRVLDVGAGSGALTRLLVEHASYLCALEPDLAHWATLQTLVSTTCVVQTGDIRHFAWVGQPFDLVLASYLLEAVDDYEDWPEIIDRLLSLRAPASGAVLAVTLQTSCPLVRYQEEVWAILGERAHRRSNTDIFPAIVASAHTPVVWRVLPSRIYADSLEELFEILTFFFVRETDSYRKAKDTLLPSLTHWAVAKDNHWELAAAEILYEIR
jgi:trans-aconitate methyltransferase